MYQHSIRRIRREDRAYTLRVAMTSRLEKPDQMYITEPVKVELFDGKEVTLPVGFVTDCHSIPLVLRATIPLLAYLMPEYDNRTNVAAIVHDFLYIHWEKFVDQAMIPTQAELIGNGQFARLYADTCYEELMRRFSPNNWRNRLYYRVVRIFGWYNWKKFRKSHFQNQVEDFGFENY